MLALLLICNSLAAHSTISPPAPASAASASPPPNADANAIELQPLGIVSAKRESLNIVFSNTGERFAHWNYSELELWQTHPLKLLVRIEPERSFSISQMMFSPKGQFNYIDRNRHHWITPDLQQGTGSKIDLLSPNGRYAVRYGPREGEEGFTPNYNGASSDVYDFQEKRSVCQFPGIGEVSNAAFTNDWFAVQLGATGPNSPKPLAVCEMATGRAFIIPFSDTPTNLTPRIDPQGRWLMVDILGKRFFGSSYWSEIKLFALPFAQNTFATNADNKPDPCAILPCGYPAPLPVAAGIPPVLPRVSPDGAWMVYANDQSVQIFKNPDMTQVAVLKHALYQKSLSKVRTNKYRLVFSSNSRWIGLQVNSHLYRIDLQGSPMRLQEVNPPLNDFNLEAISSNGLDWLVQHKTEDSNVFQGALWSARR